MGTPRCSRKRLNHPPYSPDLSPPNYFAFPKLKMELKGGRYATISDIQTYVKTKLKTIPITDFLRAMHWLEDCTNHLILQLMAITLNKKICIEFFETFFGGFRSTVSKLMIRTVYSVELR